jgi:hypothetical protein
MQGVLGCTIVADGCTVAHVRLIEHRFHLAHVPVAAPVGEEKKKEGEKKENFEKKINKLSIFKKL